MRCPFNAEAGNRRTASSYSWIARVSPVHDPRPPQHSVSVAGLGLCAEISAENAVSEHVSFDQESNWLIAEFGNPIASSLRHFILTANLIDARVSSVSLGQAPAALAGRSHSIQPIPDTARQ